MKNELSEGKSCIFYQNCIKLFYMEGTQDAYDGEWKNLSMTRFWEGINLEYLVIYL